jgi:hypothetical protein
MRNSLCLAALICTGGLLSTGCLFIPQDGPTTMRQFRRLAPPSAIMPDEEQDTVAEAAPAEEVADMSIEEINAKYKPAHFPTYQVSSKRGFYLTKNGETVWVECHEFGDHSAHNH